MSKSTPDTLNLDVEDLTIEEVELLEELTDLAIDELFTPGAKKGKTLRALAYIAARRDDPEVSLEDVGSKKLVLGDADPS